MNTLPPPPPFFFRLDASVGGSIFRTGEMIILHAGRYEFGQVDGEIFDWVVVVVSEEPP